MITRAQVLDARSMLGWSRRKLSEESGVKIFIIMNIERRNGPIRFGYRDKDTLAFIKAALERGGAIFGQDGRVRKRTALTVINGGKAA